MPDCSAGWPAPPSSPARPPPCPTGSPADKATDGRNSQAQAAPAPAAPPVRQGIDTNTKLAQLRELAQLRDSGVLDEAEFELQKSQILNS